jgi:uncharacterized integral membrane protein
MLLRLAVLMTALPFVDRPERLLYPVGFVCVFYVLLLLINCNVTRVMLELYFGHSHEPAGEGVAGELDKWSEGG